MLKNLMRFHLRSPLPNQPGGPRPTLLPGWALAWGRVGGGGRGPRWKRGRGTSWLANLWIFSTKD